MKKYKIYLNISDTIEANTPEEANKIFWDRFDSSVWKAEIEELK